MRWRYLAENHPDFVVMVDRDHIIWFLNRVAPGGTIQEHIGRPAEEFLAPQHRLTAAAHIDRAFTGQAGEYETEGPGPHGAVAWYRTRVVPVGGGEQIEHVMLIATDITEQKRVTANLRHQQRLEALETLGAGLAHEINNPLHGIMNYAALIQRHAEKDTTSNFAQEILNEAQRAASIVRDLISVTRGDTPADLPAVPAEIVGPVLGLVRGTFARDRIQIDTALPEDLPSITCRRQQLQQVLLSLLLNARDAINDRFPKADEDKRVQIRAEVADSELGPSLRLTVQDNGAGMPDAVRDRAFDPFFSTKAPPQGTGLGLFVSHRIITEHGGRIWIESSQGGPTCVSFELPLAP